MNNLKKMGFNPRGFALNQLSIPNSDKTMGGASLPQWYAGTVKKKAFDSASKPQKLVTNPKALDSSVTTDEIILNKKNLVYIDSKAFILEIVHQLYVDLLMNQILHNIDQVMHK